MFNLTSEEKGVINLAAKADLSDKLWGDEFGNLCDIFYVGQYENNRIHIINIDFSDTTWAEPTPLMSLANALFYYVREHGNVNINLGEFSPDTSEHRKRFLTFLFQEGFFKIFYSLLDLTIEDLCKSQNKKKIYSISCYLNNKKIDDSSLALLKEIKSPLVYEHSLCLPSRLFVIRNLAKDGYADSIKHTNSLNEVDRKVEQLIERYVTNVVKSKVPSWAHISILHRIQLYCRELIHNAMEHAYADSKFSEFESVMLYIRYRQGRVGASDSELERVSWGENREKNTGIIKSSGQLASSLVPQLDFNCTSTNSGFFEIFVVDNGQGITNSDASLKEEKGLNSIMYKVLNGHSRKKNRVTKEGGIYLLREVSELSEDVLRVYDLGTWWGAKLPLKRGYEEKPLANSNSKVIGLCWAARMFWDDSYNRELLQNWNEFNYSTKKELCRLYCNNYDVNIPEKVAFIDLQDGIKNRRFVQTKLNCISEVVLIPSSRWMKIRVHSELKELVIKYPNLEQLTIADVYPQDALILRASIENSSEFSLEQFKSLENVLILTKNLKYTYLKRNHVSQLFQCANSVDINRASKVLVNLRLLDSLRVWSNVSVKDSSDMSLSGESLIPALLFQKIKWNDKFEISQYLDFVQLLANLECKSVFKRAIQRFKWLLGENYEINPLDNLTNELCYSSNHQSDRYVSSYSSKEELYLGSVCLSGRTEDEKVDSGNKKLNIVNVFRHPESIKKSHFLILWKTFTNTELSSEAKIYKRVGTSPVIAKGGWKFYSLPRFGLGEVENCHYPADPKETYKFIQDTHRPLVKLGHWSNGSSHDFITVNLKHAFDSELDGIKILAGGKLASFVFWHLFRIFNLNKSDLTEEGSEIFSRCKPDDKKLYFLHGLDIIKSPKRNNRLFVYISHSVTAHIVEKFITLVDSVEAKNTLYSYIVPIIPVKDTNLGTSLQISGLTHEKIINALNREKLKGEELDVYLFDDALKSGRTNAELTSLLRNIGVKNIYSLSILDRQRLASGNNPKGTNSAFFWRFDWPTLGGGASCPICSAMEAIRSFKQSIFGTPYQKRLEDWFDTWKSKDPSLEWGNVGLTPQKIKLKSPFKKFGIENKEINGKLVSNQIGGEKNLVEIRNSIGLVSWLIELHTMTGSDELPLLMFDEHHPKYSSLSLEVQIQILTSQIFLFGKGLKRSLLKDMFRYLFKALIEKKHADNHTSIAAIALISYEDHELTSGIVASYIEEKGLKYSILEQNIDAQLLIAFYTQLPDSPLAKIVGGGILLKPKDLTEYLWRFHCEVSDIRGKDHLSSLRRLAQSSDTTITVSLNKLFVSIDLIQHVFSENKLNQLIRRNKFIVNKSEVSFELLVTDILDVIDKVKVLLNTISNYSIEHESKIIKTELIKKGKSLLNYLEAVHKEIFYPLGLQHIKTGKWESGVVVRLIDSLNNIQNYGDAFKNTRSRLKADYKFSPIVKLNNLNENHLRREYTHFTDKDFEEVYVLFGAPILVVIDNLFSNLKHSSGTLIRNPWNTYISTQSDEKAHWWINARICDSRKFLNLEFINFLDSEASNTVNENKPNLERVLSILNDFGGGFEVSPRINENEFSININLPLAHTINGNNNGHI